MDENRLGWSWRRYHKLSNNWETNSNISLDFKRRNRQSDNLRMVPRELDRTKIRRFSETGPQSLQLGAFWGKSTSTFNFLTQSNRIYLSRQGRNENEIMKMISFLREWNESKEESKRITISVEIEKSRESMRELIPLGDVVIISKEFAWYDGLQNMQQVIEKYKKIVRPT